MYNFLLLGGTVEQVVVDVNQNRSTVVWFANGPMGKYLFSLQKFSFTETEIFV